MLIHMYEPQLIGVRMITHFDRDDVIIDIYQANEQYFTIFTALLNKI